VTVAQLKEAYDVAIVGAGPAGLAAAAVTAGAGLATLLLDENGTPGGQIYRAVTSTPVRDRAILGPAYWRGAALVEAAARSGAEIVCGAVAWSVGRDLSLGISCAGAARMIRARRVILATGAQERPFPIEGWTLPGVMTAGAAQTLLKSSGLVPEGRTAIAGTGPLLWLVAAQLLRAGAKIEAILDTTPPANFRRALRHTGSFVASPLLAEGVRLLLEVRRRAKVESGVVRLAALGDSRLRAVEFARTGGVPQRLAVDQLLLHQGVVPNVNLALAAGVEHRWNQAQLCFDPLLDASADSSVPGIAVAGDAAGIVGAQAAEARGRLAGLAAVAALQPQTARPSAAQAARSLRRHARGRAFLDALFRPPRRFRVPEDRVVVCRCEEVTARQVREVAALGCQGPNQVKAFLRCGMGPCQGRMCGLTVTELLAEAHHTSAEAIGYYRLRPPVKPITLSELAGLDAAEGSANPARRP
jgi:NADPH-dependent 2,4-dienoyl-CoA reductase/sulfur reductase-like enzyme